MGTMRAGMPLTEVRDYRARYYDPTTGRFISEDPIGFKGSGTNFYAYVRNSPINLTDPLGLCPKDKKNCSLDALARNGLAFALDVAGVGANFLPGGDIVVAGVGMVVGSASTVNSAANEDVSGAFASIAGIHISAFGPLSKAIPVIGGVVSAGMAGRDAYLAYEAYEAYKACMAGSQ